MPTAKFKDSDIINHRFGTLTAIEHIAGSPNFRCQCDCGNEILVPKTHLMYYQKLSCGQCGATPASITQKYGSLSDFIIEGNSCSFCGSPFVYNQSRQLCRSCYHRFLRRGTVEYAIRPTPPAPEEVAAAKQLRKQQRRQATVDSIHPAPREDAQLMAKLYAESDMTYQQIADIFGYSRQRVHMLLHWNGKGRD